MCTIQLASDASKDGISAVHIFAAVWSKLECNDIGVMSTGIEKQYPQNREGSDALHSEVHNMSAREPRVAHQGGRAPSLVSCGTILIHICTGARAAPRPRIATIALTPMRGWARPSLTTGGCGGQCSLRDMGQRGQSGQSGPSGTA